MSRNAYALFRSSPPPFSDPVHGPDYNLMLPQKCVKNFAVAQKLWILRPFFKIFLLRKQLFIKNNKDF